MLRRLLEEEGSSWDRLLGKRREGSRGGQRVGRPHRKLWSWNRPPEGPADKGTQPSHSFTDASSAQAALGRTGDLGGGGPLQLGHFRKGGRQPKAAFRQRTRQPGGMRLPFSKVGGAHHCVQNPRIIPFNSRNNLVELVLVSSSFNRGRHRGSKTLPHSAQDLGATAGQSCHSSAGPARVFAHDPGLAFLELPQDCLKVTDSNRGPGVFPGSSVQLKSINSKHFQIRLD